MDEVLIDFLSLSDLANKQKLININLTIGDCERVADIASAEKNFASEKNQLFNWKERLIEGNIKFNWIDEEKALVLGKGFLKAEIPMVCQRCLKQFDFSMEVSIKVIFNTAGHEDIFNDFNDFDFWSFESCSNEIRLLDVIEESIILDLPLAPMHDVSDCNISVDFLEIETETNYLKPFADLKSQMKKTVKK